MFDTVNLTLSQEDVKVNLLDVVPKYLDNVYKGENKEFKKVYFTGSYKGLKVKVNEYHVKIVDRSLCKFYLGDNFQTLNRGATQMAIEAISEALHLPFDRAKVTRFDLAQNLKMKHPEELYLKYLGSCQHYKRLEQPNGLYYNNRNKQICFYSKVREEKEKGEHIPQHLVNANLLRYEVRFKKRLPEVFKREIHGATLYEENFYIEVLNRWKNEYLKIQKINAMIDSIQPTGSTKDFTDYLALVGLCHMGLNEALTMVKEWQGKGNISKKQASDLRKKIRALNGKPQFTATNEMIEELNLKVMEAVYHFP